MAVKAGISSALAVAGALTLASCGGGTESGDSACEAVVIYAGASYIADNLSPRDPRRAALIPADHLDDAGTATMPACNDQGNDNEKDRQIGASRIDGYDTSMVIAIGRTVYVNRDYDKPLPQSLTKADWLEWITP